MGVILALQTTPESYRLKVDEYQPILEAWSAVLIFNDQIYTGRSLQSWFKINRVTDMKKLILFIIPGYLVKEQQVIHIKHISQILF